MSENAPFSGHDRENSITEAHMYFQCPLSLLDCALFLLSSEKKTVYHCSSGSRKRKMMSDSTYLVVMTEKRELELLEKYVEREDDDDLSF
jgi:hypothetical protein